MKGPFSHCEYEVNGEQFQPVKKSFILQVHERIKQMKKGLM